LFLRKENRKEEKNKNNKAFLCLIGEKIKENKKQK